MLSTSCIWCLPLQHPSPVVPYQKEGWEPPNCQVQLLGYWLQFLTVFETTQEEEIRDPITLFLITQPPDFGVFALCKPQTLIESGYSSWGMSLLCSLLHLSIKPTFYFLQTCLPYFVWLCGQRKPRFWSATVAMLLDGVTDSMDIMSMSKPGRWWRAGRPGVLQSMGLQRVGHDLTTEQQHSELLTALNSRFCFRWRSCC